jgi:hypothetical protein
MFHSSSTTTAKGNKAALAVNGFSTLFFDTTPAYMVETATVRGFEKRKERYEKRQ